jgi:hypothetical protein
MATMSNSIEEICNRRHGLNADDLVRAVFFQHDFDGLQQNCDVER